MNERIQELLIEAHKQTNGGIYNGHLSVWTEKFAQLIVQECIRSIQSDMDRETMNGTISLAKHAGMVSAKTVIKKHFGVEL
jgi:hypothetical protein